MTNEIEQTERMTTRRRVWMHHSGILMLGHTVEFSRNELMVDLALEPALGTVWTVPFALSKSLQMDLLLEVIENQPVFDGRRILTTFSIVGNLANSRCLYRAWVDGLFKQVKPPRKKALAS